MSRILGIDFGEKRIGLALSDELLILAHPLVTLDGRDIKKAISEIKKICQENNVEIIILGLPKTLRGELASQARKVQSFGKELKKEINLPVGLEDERLSTSEVYKTLPKDIIRKQKNNIDQLSAQIILQSYLDKLKKDSK